MGLIFKLMFTGIPILFISGMVLKASKDESRAYWISGTVFILLMLGELGALMYLVWS